MEKAGIFLLYRCLPEDSYKNNDRRNQEKIALIN